MFCCLFSFNGRWEITKKERERKSEEEIKSFVQSEKSQCAETQLIRIVSETPGADPISLLSSFLIEPLFLFQQAVFSAKNIDQAPFHPGVVHRFSQWLLNISY